jgi:hypothetical protein
MIGVSDDLSRIAMHLSSTLLKRWPVCLLAIVVLAVLPFAVTATGASTAKSPPRKASPGRSADRSYPSAPAGPRGPIRLSCMPGRAGIVGTDGPAGPQGPVGVNCASAPQA